MTHPNTTALLDSLDSTADGLYDIGGLAYALRHCVDNIVSNGPANGSICALYAVIDAISTKARTTEAALEAARDLARTNHHKDIFQTQEAIA